MRRALALLLVAPVGLAATLAPPAIGGETFFHVVRHLDARTTVVGFDCSGAPGTEPEVRLGTSPIHVRGQGSLVSRTDALGGVMVNDPTPPRNVGYPAYPVGATDPQAHWRVEINGDVLTSDPLPLEPDTWNQVWIEDATLHGPAGWSGTMQEYVDEFGKGDHWSAGLLTGGCLGSPEVRYDAIGTRKQSLDFEGRNWVVLEATTPGGRDGAMIQYGERYRVTARANSYDVDSGTSSRVEGARIDLQRRWAGTHTWRTVSRETTDAHGVATLSGVSRRAAFWRAVWHRHGSRIPSDEALQESWAILSDPTVNGDPCALEGEYDHTCDAVDVARDRVVFKGTAQPPRSATIHMTVHVGDATGEVVSDRTTEVDRHGRWRITFRPGDADEYFVVLWARSASHQHFATGRWQVPLRVH